MQLKVLDLFSGIGNFTKGMERSPEFKTIAFCEIKQFCQDQLSFDFPGVPIFTDVKKLKGEDVGTTSIITAGFPCQDISTANPKGRGIAGARSGLWGEVARLTAELKPKYLIVENSANLRSKGLASILQDLWQIGYDAEWHVISGKTLGSPIEKERIWIIAYPEGGRQVLRDVWWNRRVQDVAETERARADYGGRTQSYGCGEWWKAKPGICIVDSDVTDRVEKLKALGNTVMAVIPQIIGEAILAVEKYKKERGTCPERV